VITKVGTISAPTSSQNPYNLFPNDTRFQLVYNQTAVLVYKLKA
jgi:hypothetical protein